MANRIAKERLEPKKFNFAGPKEVEAHIRSLVELATVVNQITSSMVTLELSIKLFIERLEAARLNAMVTDLDKTKDFFTQAEVARKLGVPVATLRKDRDGLFPRPIRGAGQSARYRGADVNNWLLNAHGGLLADVF